MARYQMGPDVQKFLMVSDAGDNMVAEIVVRLFIIVHLLSESHNNFSTAATVSDLCIKPLVCRAPVMCGSNLISQRFEELDKDLSCHDYMRS